MTVKRNCHCVLKCCFKLLFTVDYMNWVYVHRVLRYVLFCMCVFKSEKRARESPYLCYTILSKIRCPYSNYILDCRVLAIFIHMKMFYFPGRTVFVSLVGVVISYISYSLYALDMFCVRFFLLSSYSLLHNMNRITYIYRDNIFDLTESISDQPAIYIDSMK